MSVFCGLLVQGGGGQNKKEGRDLKKNDIIFREKYRSIKDLLWEEKILEISSNYKKCFEIYLAYLQCIF